MNIDSYYQLNIADITIDVFRRNIKNLHIAVYPPKGRVRIAAPKKASKEVIRLFGVSKLAWIKKAQQKFIEQERESERDYAEGESLMFQGKKYRLKLIQDTETNEVKVKQKRFIEIKTKSKSVNTRKIYENWLKTQLEEIIIEKMNQWQEITGLKPSEWKIRRMKTRWGSCNHDKKIIVLNFELIKKPEKCIDYVILHELLHLVEPKHNKNFTIMLSKHMPNWKQLKDELNLGMLPHTEWNH